VRFLLLTTGKDLRRRLADPVALVGWVGIPLLVGLLIAIIGGVFGTTPEGVIEVLAIMGDASDNIPGVKGIGEKGAAKLIAEWGTLEALLENAGQVKPKRAREVLLEQADQARLSKRLSALRDDVLLVVRFAELIAQRALVIAGPVPVVLFVTAATRFVFGLQQVHANLVFERENLFRAILREAAGDKPVSAHFLVVAHSGIAAVDLGLSCPLLVVGAFIAGGIGGGVTATLIYASRKGAGGSTNERS